MTHSPVRLVRQCHAASDTLGQMGACLRVVRVARCGGGSEALSRPRAALEARS